MAYVYPFVGTRYNLKTVPNLAEVVTPPYDCISPKAQDALYARNPRNFVRIELGKEVAGDDEYTNRYSRAANLLQEWKRDQTLVEDPRQSFYLMEQEYTAPGGKRFKRRGFFGLVRLQGYGAGQIRAHEQTFKGPKADRYRLMRATQYNLSPIFVLYKDDKNDVGGLLGPIIDKTKANVTITDEEGSVHSMWVAPQKDLLKDISEALRDRELLIADGHHRFETALHYRNEIRRVSGQSGGRHGSDYMMMYLVGMSDPGLQILPTHRALAEEAAVGVDLSEVLEDLKEAFKVEPLTVDLRKETEPSARMLLDKIGAAGKKTVAMAMVLPGGKAHILTLKRDVNPAQLAAEREIPDVVAKLDVSILHNYLIPNVWIGNPEIELDENEVIYSRDAVEMLRMLTCRKASVVFLMNPPHMKQILEVSDKGLRLPHKTTFFYPKIPSGLVMRDMRTIGA